jgi:hypothetical protein
MSAVRVGGSLCYTGWLSVFLGVMQQRLPGFAEVESPICVDVIWMHLNFDGFSDRTIHVAGFVERSSVSCSLVISSLQNRLHGSSHQRSHRN